MIGNKTVEFRKRIADALPLKPKKSKLKKNKPKLMMSISMNRKKCTTQIDRLEKKPNREN